LFAIIIYLFAFGISYCIFYYLQAHTFILIYSISVAAKLVSCLVATFQFNNPVE